MNKLYRNGNFYQEYRKLTTCLFCRLYTSATLPIKPKRFNKKNPAPEPPTTNAANRGHQRNQSGSILQIGTTVMCHVDSDGKNEHRRTRSTDRSDDSMEQSNPVMRALHRQPNTLTSDEPLGMSQKPDRPQASPTARYDKINLSSTSKESMSSDKKASLDRLENDVFIEDPDPRLNAKASKNNYEKTKKSDEVTFKMSQIGFRNKKFCTSGKLDNDITGQEVDVRKKRKGINEGSIKFVAIQSNFEFGKAREDIDNNTSIQESNSSLSNGPPLIKISTDVTENEMTNSEQLEEGWTSEESSIKTFDALSYIDEDETPGHNPNHLANDGPHLLETQLEDIKSEHQEETCSRTSDRLSSDMDEPPNISQTESPARKAKGPAVFQKPCFSKVTNPLQPVEIPETVNTDENVPVAYSFIARDDMDNKLRNEDKDKFDDEIKKAVIRQHSNNKADMGSAKEQVAETDNTSLVYIPSRFGARTSVTERENMLKKNQDDSEFHSWPGSSMQATSNEAAMEKMSTTAPGRLDVNLLHSVEPLKLFFVTPPQPEKTPIKSPKPAVFPKNPLTSFMQTMNNNNDPTCSQASTGLGYNATHQGQKYLPAGSEILTTSPKLRSGSLDGEVLKYKPPPPVPPAKPRLSTSKSSQGSESDDQNGRSADARRNSDAVEMNTYL